MCTIHTVSQDITWDTPWCGEDDAELVFFFAFLPVLRVWLADLPLFTLGNALPTIYRRM